MEQDEIATAKRPKQLAVFYQEQGDGATSAFLTKRIRLIEEDG